MCKNKNLIDNELFASSSCEENFNIGKRILKSSCQRHFPQLSWCRPLSMRILTGGDVPWFGTRGDSCQTVRGMAANEKSISSKETSYKKVECCPKLNTLNPKTLSRWSLRPLERYQSLLSESHLFVKISVRITSSLIFLFWRPVMKVCCVEYFAVMLSCKLFLF